LDFNYEPVLRGYLEASNPSKKVFLSGEAGHGIITSSKAQKFLPLLLSYGVDPNSRNHLKQTPIFCASTDVVARLLVDHGAKIELQDSKGRTALHHAALAGTYDVVNCLLSYSTAPPQPLESRIDIKDYGGRTAFSLAASGGNLEIALAILKTGKVDPESKDVSGRTPLSFAASEGHLDIMKALLSTRKVDPDSRDLKRRTAVSYAAEKGHLHVVDLLIKTGDVNPDLKDDSGRTPLSYAAGRCAAKAVELLLGFSTVDPDSVDNNKRSALHHAVSCLAGKLVGGLEQVICALLKTEKVDVLRRDCNGKSPLSLVQRRLSNPGWTQLAETSGIRSGCMAPKPPPPPDWDPRTVLAVVELLENYNKKAGRRLG
jgi:ankyrin repeat protein